MEILKTIIIIMLIYDHFNDLSHYLLRSEQEVQLGLILFKIVIHIANSPNTESEVELFPKYLENIVNISVHFCQAQPKLQLQLG